MRAPDAETDSVPVLASIARPDMTAPADKPLEPLLYASASLGRRRWRRWVRAAGLLLLLIAAVALLRHRQAIIAYAQLHYDEHACRAFVAPPAHVALEFDPAKAPALVAQPGGDYVGGLAYAQDRAPAMFVPQALRRYLGSTVKLYGGVAYVGERRSAGGTRRLVFVEVAGVSMVAGDPARKDGKTARIWIEARSLPVLRWRDTAPPPVTRGTSADIIHSREFVSGNVSLVTMATGYYGGRPDRADASRFTIEYWTGGCQDFIDGQLLDNGVVTLKPRRAIVTGDTWDNLPRDASGHPATTTMSE